MTSKTISIYAVSVCMVMILIAGTTVHASEVTGTLSSDASTTQNSTEISNGNISGTVTSGPSGSSGGGTRVRDREDDNTSASAPTGSVLGVTAEDTSTPGFPNAGIAPSERPADQSLWSSILDFFTNLLFF